METMFTTTPFTNFPVQPPLAVGHRPIATPLFSPSTFAGVAGGASNAQGLPTAPLPISGWGLGLPGALSFGVPAAFIVGETSAITAPALLAAVAMRRGKPQGPSNDQEMEDFLYDALELIPGAVDVEVRCEAGRVTLTGSVPHKRLKRDIGEIAWAIPALNDVQNNLTITSRRRGRASGREAEHGTGGSPRKQG